MSELLCYKKDGNIYFIKKHIPRRSKVLKNLGVRKNTFAGDMISRVYDYYFLDAINFRNEYRKFYKKEFDSLAEFIEERFNIEHDESIKLAKNNYSMKCCDSRSVERNIMTLNYDENFKKAFLIAIGGMKDEDQDGIYYE